MLIHSIDFPYGIFPLGWQAPGDNTCQPLLHWASKYWSSGSRCFMCRAGECGALSSFSTSTLQKALWRLSAVSEGSAPSPCRSAPGLGRGAQGLTSRSVGRPCVRNILPLWNIYQLQSWHSELCSRAPFHVVANI